MNRIFWLLIGCIFFANCQHPTIKSYKNYQADGSGFETFALDSTSLENLEVLCKVWGFVKYHHPVFADSTINIDYELFELLPAITHADPHTRNESLADWIDGLGRFKTKKSMYDKLLADKPHRLDADINWIEDAGKLGNRLSSILETLRYAERKDNRYLQYQDPRGAVNLENEMGDKGYSTSDCGYRMLTLFRYWNLVEYFYPYKDRMDRNWHDLLPEYISRIVVASNSSDYKLTMSRLFVELHDGHAFPDVYFLFGGRCIFVDTRFVEGKLIVVSSNTHPQMKKMEFRPGDEIIAIDGKKTSEIISEMRKYVSASNEAGFWEAAALYAFCSRKQEMNIRYTRNGIEHNVSYTTMPFCDQIYHFKYMHADKHCFRTINDSIGYIFVGNYNKENDQAIRNMCDTVKTIIVDMRGYPSYDNYRFINNYLLPGKTHVSTMFLPEKYLPGYFFPNEEYWGEEGVERNHFKGRILVLVDGRTMSAGEYSTMVLQAIEGTVVIGSRTAGADGTLIQLPLAGGMVGSFSSMGVYYPNGTPTQGVGVKIDKIVEPTIEGIKAGRDEVLERAVEIINGK